MMANKDKLTMLSRPNALKIRKDTAPNAIYVDHLMLFLYMNLKLLKVGALR